jgi:hypothetical protein
MKTLKFALFVTMIVGVMALVKPSPGSCTDPTSLAVPSATVACFFEGFSCTKDQCVCTGTLTATVEFVKAKENESGKGDLHCRGHIPKSDAPPHEITCQGPADGVCTITGVSGLGGFGAISGQPSGFSQDWKEVIKPSGKVSLHCHDLEPLTS